MRSRSLFWPLVLIAAGVVWFLVNLKIIPTTDLWALAYIWPFLLMALGVSLILRARWVTAGMIVSALTVVGILLAVVFAPQLGWNKAPVWGWGWDLGTNFGGSVRGSGVVRSEARQVSDFTTVVVNYPAEVLIQQGGSDSVTVEAEDNLLPQLSTRVLNGVLNIENTEPNWGKRVSPTKSVQIHITVKDLRHLEFPSAGSVRMESLQTDALQISMSGAGHVTLSKLNAGRLDVDLSGAGSIDADGTTGEVTLNISGLGSFQGQELSAQTATVDISGAGSATIWVKSQLTADISGAGSVNYYGSPVVHQDVSGVGSVNALGIK